MDSFLLNSETITISKSHYEDLLQEVQEFRNLKNSLIRGSTSPEDLDILIKDFLSPPSFGNGVVGSNPYSPLNHRDSIQSDYAQNEVSFPANRTPISGAIGMNSGMGRNFYPSPEDSTEENDFDLEHKDEEVLRNEQGLDNFDQTEMRTVDIRNLPERTTHLEVTNAIRGGALLEIFLKYAEHFARVTFIDTSAAQGFLEHSKRHGCYIGNKRVNVFPSTRQYIIHRYIKQNLDHGASRNLVIYNIKPDVTASLIREHLDHIHNLVVVDVKISQKDGTAYISTNSVNNAMFARSCMRSRAIYKGMKIDFGLDECAQPYSSSPQHHLTQQPQQQEWTNNNNTVSPAKANANNKKSRPERQQQQWRQKKTGGSSLSNRFELLNMDSTKDELASRPWDE